MSDRYRIIASLMEDPINVAIMERETRRRPAFKKLPPPIPNPNGGVYFPLLRDFQDSLTPDPTLAIASIAEDGEGWWIFISEDEVGPFPDMKSAKEEAIILLQEKGFSILPKTPWDEGDLETYPLKPGRD